MSDTQEDNHDQQPQKQLSQQQQTSGNGSDTSTASTPAVDPGPSSSVAPQTDGDRNEIGDGGFEDRPMTATEYAEKVAHGYPQDDSMFVQVDETFGGGYPSIGLHDNSIHIFTRKQIAFTAVLLLINLLNYMDRFTVAGTLIDIQSSFNVLDSELGLIQTVFICSYMLAAPVFGYAGDRYNRKLLISFGLFVWILAVLFSSFTYSFAAFLLLRALVGIGESAYSTLAPSMIGDLFKGSFRSRMLMIYFTAMPIGSGLGYISGSMMTALTGDWRWGVRATPLIGLILLVVLLLFFEDPVRGQSEDVSLPKTPYREDLTYLSRIPSYVFVTLGQTSVMFVTGALSWWAPTLAEYAWAMINNVRYPPVWVKASIARTFGILACFGGLFGVVSGAVLAKKWTTEYRIDLGEVRMKLRLFWRRITCRQTDIFDLTSPGLNIFLTFGGPDDTEPLVCAYGCLAAVPVMWLCLFAFESSMSTGWLLTFSTIVLICVNISVTTDMIISVVPPNRRSTAIAFQTMLSHLFGDAASPYLIGAVSDSIRSHMSSMEIPMHHFLALRTALYIPNVLLVFSSIFYFLTAPFIIHDRERCRNYMNDARIISPMIFAHEQLVRENPNV